MATAIKAIPTLKGREAREFLRHAEEVERKYATMSERDERFCVMPRRLNANTLPCQNGTNTRSAKWHMRYW